MLFPVRPGLECCRVFSGLNALFLELLRSKSTGTPMDVAVLPAGVWTAIQNNAATLVTLGQLDAAIGALSAPEREHASCAVQKAYAVKPLFSDKALNAPALPAKLQNAIKAFAFHLFLQTAKLVDVVEACGETVMDHYTRYAADSPPGNGNVCGMCGTELLAQRRAGVDPHAQWRAPYDHLLAKDIYPIFAVHPDNLLPVCRTCNEKAKLAKDLLHDRGGVRRLCFDPWNEQAHEKVSLVADLKGLSPVARLTMAGQSQSEDEKLTTWDDVYRIKERVEGEFSSMREKLAEDLRLTDLDSFKASLDEMATARSCTVRLTPFNFWRARLYRSLLTLPDHSLEQLRALCAAGLDPEGDASAVFGI